MHPTHLSVLHSKKQSLVLQVVGYNALHGLSCFIFIFIKLQVASTILYSVKFLFFIFFKNQAMPHKCVALQFIKQCLIAVHLLNYNN